MKETELVPLTELKGLLDASQEVIKLLQNLANKAMDQGQEDKKNAAEIMSSCLQTLTGISEKLFRMGINPHQPS